MGSKAKTAVFLSHGILNEHFYNFISTAKEGTIIIKKGMSGVGKNRMKRIDCPRGCGDGDRRRKAGEKMRPEQPRR